MESSIIMQKLSKLIDEWSNYEADENGSMGYEFEKGKEAGLNQASAELRRWIKDELGFEV